MNEGDYECLDFDVAEDHLERFLSLEAGCGS